MLRTIKRLTIALLSSFVLFTACTKDDAVPGTDPGQVKKLSKIEYADGSYESISYSSTGSIQTISNADGAGSTDTYHFAYNDSLLTEIKADDASKFVYTYTDQRLTRLDFYNSAGANVTRYEYSYANGLPTLIQVFVSASGNLPANPTYRYEQEFLDNGNLKKTTVFIRSQSSNQLVKQNEFVIDQYDDKPNTIVLFENNPFLPFRLSANNPLSEKHYNGVGNIMETVTHTYTYDEKGNPITRKTVSKTPGAAETVETATFYY